MAAVGDINQDKFTDVAIGAPLEGFGAGDGASYGSVYIYNGHSGGLYDSPSQVTLQGLPCRFSGVQASHRENELKPRVSFSPKCLASLWWWTPVKAGFHQGLAAHQRTPGPSSLPLVLVSIQLLYALVSPLSPPKHLPQVVPRPLILRHLSPEN